MIKIVFRWSLEGQGRKWHDQEPDPDPDPLVIGTDPLIRIRTKMSRIHTTLPTKNQIQMKKLGQQQKDLIERIFFFYNCFTFLIHAESATVPSTTWDWIRIQDPRSGTWIRIRTKFEFKSATQAQG